MSKTIMTAMLFCGSMLLGGMVYKALDGCEGISIPDCAKITLSNKQRDGGLYLNVTPQPGHNQMAFQVTSNVMCPFDATLGAEIDKTTLPQWTLGDIIRPAYVPNKTVSIVNGSGYVTLTPENQPALRVVPTGRYIAKVAFVPFALESSNAKFFAKQFSIATPDDLSSTETFRFESSLGSMDSYKEYLNTWLRMVFKARQEGVTAQNIKSFEKELGQATVTQSGREKTYLFPETMHSMTVDGNGALLAAKRYHFEAEGGQ